MATGGFAGAAGSTSTSTGVCAQYCGAISAQPWSQGISSHLDPEELCFVRSDTFSSGNCGNLSSRTLKINGVTMPCDWDSWSTQEVAAIPAEGQFCIYVSAGNSTDASFNLW